MDAALDAQRVSEQTELLLAARDYEAAEEFLLGEVTTDSPTLAAFVHLQFARLYQAWNKLTSAIDHLHRASELGGVDSFVRLQIARELGGLREARGRQRP